MTNVPKTVTAKRGDLVVIQEHHVDFALRGDNREYDTFTVGQVTSVTRDGQVKMFKEAGHTDQADYLGRPDRGRALPSRHEHVMVMSAKDIDVTGALATAACHVWAGHETQVKAYDSLAGVRDALRPHQWGDPANVRLPLDARENAAARGAAWKAYQRGQGAGIAFDSARYGRYVAEVAAANDAYRAAYAAATVREPVSA